VPFDEAALSISALTFAAAAHAARHPLFARAPYRRAGAAQLGFSRKLLGNNNCRKVVVVARKIRDLDLRIGDPLLDQAFYLGGFNCHCDFSIPACRALTGLRPP
jgi:hypothetical protein